MSPSVCECSCVCILMGMPACAPNLVQQPRVKFVGRCATPYIGAYDWVPKPLSGTLAELVQASPWTPWHSHQVLELVKPGCRCQETQQKLSLMPLEESLLPQFPGRYLTACSLLRLLVLDPKFWTICMRFIREKKKENNSKGALGLKEYNSFQ